MLLIMEPKYTVDDINTAWRDLCYATITFAVSAYKVMQDLHQQQWSDLGRSGASCSRAAGFCNPSSSVRAPARSFPARRVGGVSSKLGAL